MGNIIAPAPPPQPALVLEEDSECRALLTAHLQRAQVGNPQLRRILTRSGTAAAVCSALKGGAGGAGSTARDGFSALHVACAIGWDELVVKFLQAGAIDVNAASQEGYTPLMLAAMCGRAGAVRAVLQHGGQLGARSRRGATAIAFAAQSVTSLDSLRLLLAHNQCTAELVRQLGHRQRSPLLLAVLSHGNAAVVRALVGAGADPSERCSAMANNSVLHSCAHLSRVDAMRELLAAGAQVNVATEDGISVLQELFVQPPSRQRSEAAKRQMFGMLVRAGADVNSRVPERNFTVLHFMLASCREEATAKLALDSGVDISIAVNEPVPLGDGTARHTVLHLACMRGWSQLAERLVGAGADMSLRNKDGLQPLHSAILGNHSEAVAVLLRRGADPRATCPDCYPSFSKWKLQRGLQAMHALMHAGEAADIAPALAALFGGADHELAGSPRLTAVDLACCVARHIPTVEAFVERGVLPSPAALDLAEHAVPIMRAVVERPILTPRLAARLPPRFRAAARELLLCLNRPTRTADGSCVALTPDAVAAVLQQAAYPVSRWADAAWLMRQQVREPRARAPPAAPQPAPGGQPQHAAQALPGGFPFGPGGGIHVFGAGDALPPDVQEMVQQMQQQMGAAGAQPQVIIMQQHIGMPPGAPAGAAMPAGGLAGLMQAGAAAGGPVGGGLAGLGAQMGGLGGPQLVQHHHAHQGPGEQLHVMQFQIPMGDLPFMMPPGGMPPLPAGLGVMGHNFFGGGGAGPGAAGPAAGVPPPVPMPGPPGQAPPALAGMMQQVMQGLFGQMGGQLGGPAGAPFGGLPMLFDDVMPFGMLWDDDEEEEVEEDGSDDEFVDAFPEVHVGMFPPQQHQQPQPQPQPPALQVPQAPQQAAAGAAADAGAAAGVAAAGGAARGQAGPSRQPSAGDEDQAGPSRAAGGKRSAGTSGACTSHYNLRDRSKRQRHE